MNINPLGAELFRADGRTRRSQESFFFLSFHSFANALINGSHLHSASTMLACTLSTSPTLLACTSQPRPPRPRHATHFPKTSLSYPYINFSVTERLPLQNLKQFLGPVIRATCLPHLDLFYFTSQTSRGYLLETFEGTACPKIFHLLHPSWLQIHFPCTLVSNTLIFTSMSPCAIVVFTYS